MRFIPLLPLLACSVLVNAEEIGFRNDGRGHFPEATPPTSWDLASGQNVAWSVAMPTASNSSPLVVAGRVITVAHPERVLCYDAESGEERWSTTAPVVEALPPGEQAEAGKLFAEGWKVLEEYIATPRKQRSNDLKKQYKEYWSKRGDLAKRWGMVGPNDFGWSMPTPIWDGERIIVRFETGALAAFDLDGQRQWLTRVPDAGHETPLLADDMVVVTQRDSKKPIALVAVNRANGQGVWRTEELANPHDTFHGGGPALMRIDDRAFVVSHGGELLDAANGTIVGRCAVEGNARASTPVVVDDVVFFPAQPDHGKGVSGVEAFRVTAKDGKLAAAKLWQTEPTGKETMTSPLWTGPQVVMVYDSEPYLWSFSAESGELLNGDSRKKLGISMGGHHPSPSPALVSGVIFAFGENGNVAIAKPGPDPQVVTELKLEHMGGTPFFSDGRMYVRTHDHLICIGK